MSELPQPRSVDEMIGDIIPIMQQALTSEEFDDYVMVDALARIIVEADDPSPNGESGLTILMDPLLEAASSVGYDTGTLNLYLLYALDGLRRKNSDQTTSDASPIEDMRGVVRPPEVS